LRGRFHCILDCLSVFEKGQTGPSSWLDASSLSEDTLREIASVLPAPAQAMTWRRPPRWAITFSVEGLKAGVVIDADLSC
jgi:hypothetical protein